MKVREVLLLSLAFQLFCGQSSAGPIHLINPWTGREVELEDYEAKKQEELGTKDELFAVDLAGYDENRRVDNKNPGSEYYGTDGKPLYKKHRKSPYGHG